MFKLTTINLIQVLFYIVQYKMIIAITGKMGSGKTYIADKLSQELG